MRVYVARQPIFDRQKVVYGYELLYRSNAWDNAYDTDVDGDWATRAVVSDAMVTIGMDRLVGRKSAFINFPRSLLLSNFPFLIHPREFVIEILEDTQMDAAVLERLKLLKKRRYTLALDDYTGNPALDPAVEYVDILKVDFKLTNHRMQRKIAEKYRDKKQLLAEKVESEAEFLRARREGYRLFQGFYFSQPMVVSHKTMNIASMTYLRLWQEIQRPIPSFDRMEEIIRSDVNLAYKLLQRINTMEYYRGHRVHSVKRVLVQMGLNEIKRWVQLILMRDVMGSVDNDELVRMSLVRGLFAEKVIKEAGYEEYNEAAYTMGLFSAVEEEIRDDVVTLLQKDLLPAPYRSALSGESSILTDVVQFTISYETGDWERAISFVAKHNLDEDKTALYYLQAVEYADKLFGDATVPQEIGPPP